MTSLLNATNDKIVFVDVEVRDEKIFAFGAVKASGQEFSGESVRSFSGFLNGCKYVCGHNILRFDLKYLSENTIVPVVSRFLSIPYPTGTTCIVARTNEEVLSIAGLLQKKWHHSPKYSSLLRAQQQNISSKHGVTKDATCSLPYR